jgi:uncharacterized protein (DUF1810 family)
VAGADDDPADRHDLRRFVVAQDPVYAQVCAELARGAKQSHWMWFMFPQLKELGRSAMARRYGIASLAEARAYLAHPLLGARLAECTRLMLAIEGKSALTVLGSPDDLKFCSSMTLFATVAGPASSHAKALDRFFGGVADARTLALLGAR